MAIERLFTSTSLVSLLSTLTIWNMQKLIQEWNNKVQKNNRIQQLVLGFKQDTEVNGQKTGVVGAVMRLS